MSTGCVVRTDLRWLGRAAPLNGAPEIQYFNQSIIILLTRTEPDDSSPPPTPVDRPPSTINILDCPICQPIDSIIGGRNNGSRAGTDFIELQSAARRRPQSAVINASPMQMKPASPAGGSFCRIMTSSLSAVTYANARRTPLIERPVLSSGAQIVSGQRAAGRWPAPVDGGARAPAESGHGNLGEQTAATLTPPNVSALCINSICPPRSGFLLNALDLNKPTEPVHQEAAWLGVGDQMSAGRAELATGAQWEPQLVANESAGKVSRLETRARLTPHFPTELGSIQLCGIGRRPTEFPRFQISPTITLNRAPLNWQPSDNMGRY